MVNFRACPRCQGDMKVTRDMYGDYKECLQCGYMVDIQQEPKQHAWMEEARKRPGKKSEAA